MIVQNQCPCLSGQNYISCCGKFISGQELPSTPEELMRSRFTAYSQNNIDYISATMKSPASDRFNPEAAKLRGEKIKWFDLKIITNSQEGNRGWVEFYASYKNGDNIQVLHEISEFRCDLGKWFYITGVFPD